MAGDEDYNPLAQYEDLAVLKDAEIATKQTVCLSMQFQCAIAHKKYRRRFLLGKHNMWVSQLVFVTVLTVLPERRQ